MKRIYNLFFLALLCMVSTNLMFAQSGINGSVKGADGSPLIGAAVVLSPGTDGTITDIDGNYSLECKPGKYTLTVSYVGFQTKTMAIEVGNGMSTQDITMEEGMALDDIVVVGSRAVQRSSTTTPLAVDVLSAKDLMSTGQTSFDKALQYRIPSFNTVQTPVNDATSLLDPYEIRNMGPSRTLILINGKRKNMSSLLYVQTSPGRGETGADISAIPTDMIKRVEILRDGASAQYGSDAIAGVMNIILKDNAEDGSVTFRGGVTTKGDGEMFGIALNNGTKLGTKGFVNYTVDLSKIGLANRPGSVSAEGEAGDFGADLATVKAFLAKYPDARNINGSPETTAAKFAANFNSQLSAETEMYGNAAYIYKKVNSFANYRTPYWRTLADFPYLQSFFPNGPNGEYIGYVPTFDGDLNDYNGTVGFKSKKGAWILDGSYTLGGNEQTYKVTNSQNRNGTMNPDSTNKYRENSPLSFSPGGTRFTHNVFNIDLSRRLNDIFGLGIGSEFRTENFTVIEGDQASYEDGGADSFAGNDPRNSGTFNRYNFGGYVDLAVDLTKDFLVNATGRLEQYSDFGNAFVWKLSSRYKMNNDKITVRGSVSTGFKAPTLHQIYTQKAQYSFVPGQGIQVGGLISNVSREARLLGLSALNPEKSTNITVGLGLKATENLSVTLDYYNIAVKDRIILSTEIGSTDAGNTPLDKILAENNLSDLSFFANGLDSKTSGIDFVANYRGLSIGSNKLGVNLSGNYTLTNEIDGKVKNPALVESAGQSISNLTQQALFFTSRPKFKAILGFDLDLGKIGVSLNNTVFGPTTFRQQGLDAGLYTEFATKVVTDLGLTFSVTDKSTISLNVNNLLNVLPEWSYKADKGSAAEAKLGDAAYLAGQTNLITFNGRYSQTTYDGSHFSQLGTILNAAWNLKF
jgi:iron complex outermembrane recepter protein